MISGQVIQTSIDELKSITRVDIAVYDLNGMTVASTAENMDIEASMIKAFAESVADSQVMGPLHLLKIFDDGEAVYVLVSRGMGEDAYMIGKIGVSQLQNLLVAYKEKYDRNSFFQNLLLDNLLLVDIYNRARKLHLEDKTARVVYLIESSADKDNIVTELIREIFTSQMGDYVTAVDETSVILIKNVEKGSEREDLRSVANTIVDMLNTEAMIKASVSYGTVVHELKDVSKSYKEAKMALEVGKIFYAEKGVVSYSELGIGRLIYQLPVNLCKMFIEEIFGNEVPDEIDDNTIKILNKFFDNDLNVSKTSTDVFLHRNTLMYRIEKIHQATGLDVRTFNDALTFKIALMVVNYMRYLENHTR